MRVLKSLLALILLLSSSAQAQFKVMEAREVYAEYAWNTYSAEPWLAPNYSASNRFDLHVNVDFFNRYAFIDTMVHSLTDSTQYRLVGLQYRIGLRPIPQVELYFEHYSQHLLDYVPNMPNAYDSVGIKVYIYKRKD